MAKRIEVDRASKRFLSQLCGAQYLTTAGGHILSQLSLSSQLGVL